MAAVALRHGRLDGGRPACEAHLGFASACRKPAGAMDGHAGAMATAHLGCASACRKPAGAMDGPAGAEVRIHPQYARRSYGSGAAPAAAG